MSEKYTNVNAKTIDSWVENGWEWGTPISHEVYERARRGDWQVVLAAVKPVPKEWFPPMAGCEVLGLACGGGQQMAVFAALGARGTVLDFSEKQLENDRLVARREGYEIRTIRADMTEPLPFPDESFDMIFHPVSNCYVEDVEPIWRECFRVLRHGGLLLAGLENGIDYAFSDDGSQFTDKLPYNPLKNKEQYEQSMRENSGVQFSHTIEEQIGGQLRAGFILRDVYQDTCGYGKLHEYGIPSFYVTKAEKL